MLARAQRHRRSRLEINIDVLNVINSGIKKPTIIMYRSKLSWTNLQKILKSMIERGLIIEKHNELSKDKRTKRTYEITEKGKYVVRYFKEREKTIDFNTLGIYYD